MSRSPIDMMIDQACGINQSQPSIPKPELEPEAQVLLNLADAGVSWWKAKRPSGWTTEEHLEDWAINCCNSEDCDLAAVIIEWVKLGGDKDE